MRLEGLLCAVLTVEVSTGIIRRTVFVVAEISRRRRRLHPNPLAHASLNRNAHNILSHSGQQSTSHALHSRLRLCRLLRQLSQYRSKQQRVCDQRSPSRLLLL